MPPPPAAPPKLASLVARGVVDASTAALAWILLERGVPALVAGRDHAVVDALLDGLVAALPPDRRPDEGASRGGERLVRVAGRLGADNPRGVLRAALGVTSRRSGLVAAVDAGDLAGVLAALRGEGLTDDEVSFLGMVLVIGPADSGAAHRGGADEGGPPRACLVAAHYLRPVLRDAGGHPRRLGPAILAAWDAAAVAWEDFAWGIVPDLAERIGMRAGDLEVERGRRATVLAGAARGEPVG